MITPENITQLYQRFLNKDCSAAELKQLFSYFGTADEGTLRSLIKAITDEEDAEPENEARTVKLEQLYNKIGHTIAVAEPEKRKNRIRIYRITAGIAAIITIAILSTYLFQKQGSSDQNITKTIKDIAPGGNFATLKLADGRTISLKDQQNGTISNESGISISKTSDGQLVYTIDQKDKSLAKESYNTITTPMGGQYQVHLPDHSIVWLNAASSLTYATTLNKQGQRWVRLESGEAYFEVAKDKAHPFIVFSSGQEVTVLGTHFNINSYVNEGAIKTTLLEGSVKIQSSAGNKVLVPGQQAAVTGNQIKITPVDTEVAIAWKNGLFVFNEADVPAIMRQISRWYNVEVQYSGAIPNNLISGGIERNSNLTTAMKMLEMVGIKYQLVQVGNTKKIIIH